MHYKDGTPAKIGDIVKHDYGSVGIVIGGTIGSDYCTTHVVKFESVTKPYGGVGPGFLGALREQNGTLVARAGVSVVFDSAMQTRECLKIDHVDIGHG